MLMSLTLQHNDGTVTVVDVNSDDLGTTSIITHGGAYFMYAGLSGMVYDRVRFNEVSPPAELTSLTKNTPARIKPA